MVPWSKSTMDFISTYGKEIVSLLVPFITWFLNVGIRSKAKLIWTTPHSYYFIVQEPLKDSEGNIHSPSQKVVTASYKVINTGRDTANKVELIFNWAPQYINVWPARHYEIKEDQDKRQTLIFENLSPKENIGIEVMSVNADLPELLVVRCAECTAKNVPIKWIQEVPKWLNHTVLFLVAIGFSTSIYFALTIIQFLVLKTPH